MRSKFSQINLWLFLFFVASGFLAQANAATVYGVTTTNQLVRFDTAAPGNVTTVGAITGLQSGENILGIDFRPATGELYALGSTSRIYTIDTASAAATAVGAPFSSALSGTEFGFDFNPVPDLIRIVSNTGQNLRANPNTGALAGTDTSLTPAGVNVTAAAYTNNFAGTTTTTLYGIDSNTNSLVLQGGINGMPSPNGGVITQVGALGVDPTDVNGFDFGTGANTAYAALTVGGATNLYTINLTTGAATSVGAIGGGVSLRGIAVEIGATPGYQVYGLTSGNNLIRFNATRANNILSTVAISGLQPGESIVGIDVRPATGQLFGLGSTSRLYVINPLTGAASPVGNAPFSITLSGTDFGFDFNPTVDRIRIVSNTGQNFRANPDTGAAVTPADTNLGPGTPNVVAAAYTNNFPNQGGPTTLYDIDSNSDTLVIQGGINGTPSPNGGVLTNVGALGVNATANLGFDIATGSNVALASIQVQGETASKLYAINLTTGSAAFISPIGGGEIVGDLAIAVNSANFAVDFDGDRRTDAAVFRPANNTWLAQRSSNNTLFAQPWGLATDLLIPGDYDGDGRTDTAVFRDGGNFVLRSSDNTFFGFQFGTAGDQPVHRDYDGDGKTDFAVARRGGGVINWFIAQSATSYSLRAVQFGLESDVVTPGDFDGDGRSDVAVQRSDAATNAATFLIQQSTLGFLARQWGQGSDIYVPGDYDGDGKSDITVVRQGTNYTWFTLFTSSTAPRAVQWGGKPQLTAQGDYDGDGRTDVAVWNPLSGTFFAIRSSNNAVLQIPFGQNGDNPIANADSY
jgi:hypothetical protein